MTQDPSRKRILSRLTARCLTDEEVARVSGGDSVESNPNNWSYCGPRPTGHIRMLLVYDDVEA